MTTTSQFGLQISELLWNESDRVFEVDVGAHSSLMHMHDRAVVVAHCYLRVARVSLHNLTHCFQLHRHTVNCRISLCIHCSLKTVWLKILSDLLPFVKLRRNVAKYARYSILARHE